MNAALAPMLALAAALTAGCAAPVDATTSDPEAPAAPAAASVHGVQSAALRLEQAERNLDVGRDASGARAAIEEVLRDPSISREQRDEGRLALSRALEATGDGEGAIAAVEGLLADHPDRERWPLSEATETRLRKLLTGSESAPLRPRRDEGPPPVPFTHALTRYFPVPADEKQPLDINVVTFGYTGASEQRGTFEVGRALREERRQACSLCEDHLHINGNGSGYGSWTSIPVARKRLASALVVYYFDLGDRIPARYDAELPLPSAEIAARLERGEGLLAARERPGAPPVLLIAAPRAAQLGDVEETLATMKALPVEPVSVPIKAGLKAAEIQAVVRASFGAYRVCYESVLKKEPAAAGKVDVRFVIQGDGSASGISVVNADGNLSDPTFEACVTATTRALVFPALGTGTTTVTYPIAFAPGE